MFPAVFIAVVQPRPTIDSETTDWRPMVGRRLVDVQSADYPFGDDFRSMSTDGRSTVSRQSVDGQSAESRSQSLSQENGKGQLIFCLHCTREPHLAN